MIDGAAHSTEFEWGKNATERYMQARHIKHIFLRHDVTNNMIICIWKASCTHKFCISLTSLGSSVSVMAAKHVHAR